MGTVAIVAIPQEDDKVYRISSEKVPHLTLAVLGEDLTSDELMSIVGFVEHASSQLSPFGLSVDYRGELGVDAADVVFFDKGDWSFPRISSYRSNLLLNDTIRAAYESVDQFEEWTPHLTLGYPATPAKKDESDYPGIHYVMFDRVAVWIDEFDGPTFRLRYEDHGMDSVMAMSATSAKGHTRARELFHYGKKGMRWGVTTVDKATKPTVTQNVPARRGSKDVTVTQRKAGTYAKAKGGQRHTASDDAVKAVAARQKAKKSTTDALSNDELRAAVERMNLEQQYSKLESKTKRRGQGFVSQLFQSPEVKATAQDLAKKVANA